MIYELINPHDPLTFEAPDGQVAALLCLAVGPSGSYGARTDDAEGEDWTMKLFSTAAAVEAEFAERWGAGIGDSLGNRKAELIAALRTVQLATVAERAGVQAALDACPTQEARDAFLVTYEDKKRSSLSDVASRARELAAALEAGPSKEEVECRAS